MNDALTDILSVAPRLSWLTGPIFDKELRVSSRRRRNYVLRSVYVVLLSLFILYVWFVTVSLGRGASVTVFQVSRMARVGKNVITTIVWFQFVAAQLIAIVMLSTSISGEIRQRTLSVLMTTPINSLQIVMGKLLSQLLQTVLLLGISVPLLAIVRVFGGVPLDYVVSSLCITLTAAVFAGSLSLLMSITSRQAYTVVLTIVTGYLIVFGALPGLIALVSPGARGFLENVMLQGNPFATMFTITYGMLALPGRAGTFSSWPLHCVIMLGATAAVVTLAVWRVRKIALSEAFGGGKGQSKAAESAKAASRRRRRRAAMPIRRVDGPPVVWKEMRKPFSRRGKRVVVLYAVLAGMILVSFVPMLFTGGGRIGVGYALFYYLLSGFSLIAIVRVAVLSAASITSEKEASTWPILLATPLDDTEILRGKAIAAFRRNVVLLAALLVLRVVVRLLMRFGGPSALYSWLYLIPEVITLAGTVVLVIGLGLYFGIRLKSTNAAVAATVGVYIGLAYFCCGMFSNIFLYPLLFRGRGGVGIMGFYSLVMLARTAFIGLAYAALGIFAFRRARRRLRYSVF